MCACVCVCGNECMRVCACMSVCVCAYVECDQSLTSSMGVN